MQLIRRSEVVDFLRCRLRWKYRWLDRLKPKRPDGKLFFGTLFHKWLETYYETKDAERATDAWVQMFNDTDTSRMEQVELDELYDMLSRVTSNYLAQWPADRNWEIVATELTFCIPLDDNIAYTGTIDLIWKDENGFLWPADHKTVSSIDRYAKAAEMDTQISLYMWAIQQLARGNGYIWADYGNDNACWLHIDELEAFKGKLSEPHGFIYNLILKDYPEPPALLKKGGLSKAMNQKTTYSMYVKALYDNDLYAHNGEDGSVVFYPEYDEILNHLSAQETEDGNRYFRRVKVYRNQDEIDAAIEEFYNQAQERNWVCEVLTNNKQAFNPIHRNITYECASMCQYKGLCQASMDGSNVDMLKNLMYEVMEDEDYGELSGQEE